MEAGGTGLQTRKAVVDRYRIQDPTSNRWAFCPNRHYFDGERYPAPYYRMNTLTLYLCPGAPCPSWPAKTPPGAKRDMQIRAGRPRPPHANSGKQKNERTNPIPPNPNSAMLVQRNIASILGAADVKLPLILGPGACRRPKAQPPGPSVTFHPANRPMNRRKAAGRGLCCPKSCASTRRE